MKTTDYFQRASDRLSEMIKASYYYSAPMTLEEKETQARLDGCAILYIDNEVYRYNDIIGKWTLIHVE